MNAGGGVERVPGRARDDRDGRPLAGARDGADRAPGRARGARACSDRRASAAAVARPSEPRIAVCPSQRAAMVYALHEAERDAMRASVVARSLAIEGVDLVMWLERDAHEAPARGGDREPRARRAALRPRRRAADPRGRGWSVEGRLGVLGAERATAARHARLPRRARAGVVGAHLPHLGRGAALGRARLRVHRLGPPGPRRRRQPRLAARQRLARRAGDQRRRAAAIRSPPSGRSATSRRSCCPISASGCRGRLSARWRAAAGGHVPSPDASRPVLSRADLLAMPALRRPAWSGVLQPGPRLTIPAQSTAGSTPLRPRRPAATPSQATNPEAPIPVAPSNTPPAGRTLSSERVLAIASGCRRSAARRREYPGSYGGAYLKGPLPLAGELLLPRAARRRSAQVIIDDLSGRVLERGRASRSRGRWPAATPAPSASTSTRCTSGCPCACCSCCRSSTSAGRCRCCTSTCSCCCPSRSRWRSSTTPTSTRRCRSPIRRCSTCWRACSRCCAGARRARRAAPAAPARPRPAGWPSRSCS